MKKRNILLTLISLLCICFICFAAVGCDKETGDGPVSATYAGVKDIHVKVGEATDESLLEGVTATLANGNSVSVTFDKGDADYSVAGMYLIKYTCAESKSYATARLYVYGDMVIYLNDEEITTAAVTMKFSDAIDSNDFHRGIEVKDSFGKSLEVTVTENSDKFIARPDVYYVTYEATDACGQKFSKQVAYDVQNDGTFGVTNGTVDYSDESVTLSVLLGQSKDAWLEDAEGNIIDSTKYDLTENHLVIKPEVFQQLPVGDNEMTLVSKYGAKTFKLTVTDEGTPTFSLVDLAKSRMLAGKDNVLPIPESKIPAHTYNYEYTLKKGDIAMQVTESQGNLVVKNQSGGNLDVGEYTLTVKAINADKTTKTATKTINLEVYPSDSEFFSWGYVGNTASMTNVVIDEITYQSFDMNHRTQSHGDNYYPIHYLQKTNAYKYLVTEVCVTEIFGASGTNANGVWTSDVTDVKKMNGRLQFYDHSNWKPKVDNVTFIDKDGNQVDYRHIVVGEWYTAVMDLESAAIPFGDKTQIELVIYPDLGAYCTGEMLFGASYFSNEYLLKVENKVVGWNAAESYASVQYEKVDGQIVQHYVANGSAWQNRILINGFSEKHDVLVVPFKYNSADNFTNSTRFQLSASATTGGDGNLIGITNIYDPNGNIVAFNAVQTGVWYTAVVDLHGFNDKDRTVTPGDSTSITLYASTGANDTDGKVDFDMYLGKAQFIDSGLQNSATDLALRPNSESATVKTTVYNSTDNSAYYKLTSSGKTAYVARSNIKLAAAVDSVTFDMYYVSLKDSGGNNLSPSSILINHDDQSDKLEYTFKDANGNTVAKEDLKTETWYTVTVNTSMVNTFVANGLGIYFGGYADNASFTVYVKNLTSVARTAA